MNKELKTLAALVGIFALAYWLPLGNERVREAVLAGFEMLQWYARNHTLACVVPALFIAGAITTLLSPQAVLKHLGPKANKVEAYGVASVAGTVLAVCSCSVLPMFAGIYRIGAGLGPASAFLYAGPAINVLALFLTARVLGFQLGVARVVGAIVFGIVIGLLMALLFRRDEQQRSAEVAQVPDGPPSPRAAWQTVLLLGAMIALLVFSDWFNPGDKVVTLRDGTQFDAVLRYETRDEFTVQLKEAYSAHRVDDVVDLPKSAVASLVDVDNLVVRIHHIRWYLAGAMGVAVALMAWRWMRADERQQWFANTWMFAKLLLPLLFGGVLVVGFLGALLPERQVAALVGDNSVRSNLIASVIGCLFYFATLTEIPIIEALMHNGMAPGPALALLLAGPALSIPSILVIRSILGNAKTLVFTSLVVVMATATGLAFGYWVGDGQPTVPGAERPAAAANPIEPIRATSTRDIMEPTPLTMKEPRMKLVQVLGPGCAKCDKLKELAQTAAEQAGVEATVEKISDMNVILGFGVMATPALVVDGEVKVVGRLPTAEEIVELLT